MTDKRRELESSRGETPAGRRQDRERPQRCATAGCRRCRRRAPARTRACFGNRTRYTRRVARGGGPPPAAPRVRNTHPSGRLGGRGGVAPTTALPPSLAHTPLLALEAGSHAASRLGLRHEPHALRKSSRSSSTKRAFITATTWFCTSTNSCISAYTVLSRSAGSLRCGARRTIYRQQGTKSSQAKSSQAKLLSSTL